MDYIAPAADARQCDVFKVKYPNISSDCCADPSQSRCRKTGLPTFSQSMGFSAAPAEDKNEGPPLTWAQVRDQIHCRNKPFAYTYKLVKGGHAVAVVGYATVTQKYYEMGVPRQRTVNYLHVNDPLPVGQGDFSIIPYDEYVGDWSKYQKMHWISHADVEYAAR